MSPSRRSFFSSTSIGDVIPVDNSSQRGYKRFFHVVLPDHVRSDQEGLRQSLRNVFKEMVSNKCESVVLPQLGVGKNFVPADFAQILLEELYAFKAKQKPQDQKFVRHVTVAAQDPSVADMFRSVIDQVNPYYGPTIPQGMIGS